MNMALNVKRANAAGCNFHETEDLMKVPLANFDVNLPADISAFQSGRTAEIQVPSAMRRLDEHALMSIFLGSDGFLSLSNIPEPESYKFTCLCDVASKHRMEPGVPENTGPGFCVMGKNICLFWKLNDNVIAFLEFTKQPCKNLLLQLYNISDVVAMLDCFHFPVNSVVQEFLYEMGRSRFAILLSHHQQPVRRRLSNVPQPSSIPVEFIRTDSCHPLTGTFALGANMVLMAVKTSDVDMRRCTYWWSTSFSAACMANLDLPEGPWLMQGNDQEPEFISYNVQRSAKSVVHALLNSGTQSIIEDSLMLGFRDDTVVRTLADIKKDPAHHQRFFPEFNCSNCQNTIMKKPVMHQSQNGLIFAHDLLMNESEKIPKNFVKGDSFRVHLNKNSSLNCQDFSVTSIKCDCNVTWGLQADVQAGIVMDPLREGLMKGAEAQNLHLSKIMSTNDKLASFNSGMNRQDTINFMFDSPEIAQAFDHIWLLVHMREFPNQKIDHETGKISPHILKCLDPDFLENRSVKETSSNFPYRQALEKVATCFMEKKDTHFGKLEHVVSYTKLCRDILKPSTNLEIEKKEVPFKSSRCKYQIHLKDISGEIFTDALLPDSAIYHSRMKQDKDLRSMVRNWVIQTVECPYCLQEKQDETMISRRFIGSSVYKEEC